MEKESIIVIGVITAITVLICLLSIKLNEYFDRFNRKTRILVYGLEHAKNAEEFNSWNVKIRCHYLTLIPFVNADVAKKIYPKIFKESKGVKVGFFHVIAPSIVGICACTICLSGMSWAWFSASTSMGTAQIKSAYMNFDVTVTDNENNTVYKNTETGRYELENDKAYNVVLTVNGTASTGFADIVFGGTTYHTPQLKDGDIFKFSLKTDTYTEAEVLWQWGTCAAKERLEDGCTLTAVSSNAVDND